MIPRLIAAVLLVATLCRAEDGVPDWNQWRGPERNGSVRDAKWPSTLQNKLKQVWRVDLGPSYSGTLVVGERVFTTETRDKQDEIVRALDRVTGKELWSAKWPGAMSVPFFAMANGSWIRATPACDGERLYIAGMRDILVCLDAASGALLWRQDFPEQLKTQLPAFGFASSPLVDGEFIYCQAGASVACLNKRTGAIVWRALQNKGGMEGSAFSSPVIGTLAGDRQLIVLTREKLAGLSLLDGRVLWEQKIDAFRGMNILTPVIHGDSVFTAAYGGKSHLIEIKKVNDQLVASDAWQHKAQGNMSTPVVVNDCAYLLQRSQRLICLDLKNKQEKWACDTSFGTYWSLVCGGDKILGLDQRGILYLLQASPEKFVQLDSLKISENETWAHLAIHGNEIYIRELNALTVYNWEH